MEGWTLVVDDTSVQTSRIRRGGAEGDLTILMAVDGQREQVQRRLRRDTESRRGRWHRGWKARWQFAQTAKRPEE